jgi:23S rRNA-/tRNA-specific pseudouridylate synthase
VVGVPSIDEGLIDLPLAKQPGSAAKDDGRQSEHGQPPSSRYRVIDRAGNRCCWVELQPLTGRTHQLRVHGGHRPRLSATANMAAPTPSFRAASAASCTCMRAA